MLAVIDTATSQWNLDFSIAFGEGFRDCYVKMGGDNVDTYVAPWYARQVDRARAAGFRHIGHYWVPDGNPADADAIDTPTQQADYMVDRLHDFRPATDFFVLDNEALDGAWMLTDAGAAEFIERLKARKGIPGRQVAMYGGWYDLAAHAWPLVLATGAMFIVADYRTASQPGMNFPDIPTIPRSRIIGHQYGGRAIGGVVTDTNTFVDDAFNYGGGFAMTLEQKAREFGAKYPTPKDSPSPSTDLTWDQNCGIAMFQFGSFLGWRTSPIGDISSAYRAYRNSHIESRVPAGAPVGAYHWWDIGGEANGHVAQQVDGNSLVFMGSATVWEDLGVDIGFSSVAEYGRQRPAARYLGWSRDYSGGTPNLTATAGGGYTPIEEDDMQADERAALFAIKDAIFNGGTSMKDERRSISESLSMINGDIIRGGDEAADAAATRTGQYSKDQELADHGTILRALYRRAESGGVDVPQLAEALAPLVVAGVVAKLPQGAAYTLEEIASASAAAVRAELASNPLK